MRLLLLSLTTLCCASLQAGLQHRWSFDGNGVDSVGGATASFFGGATTVGGELELNGSGAYAQLPIDATLSGLTNATFETWATYDTLTAWARIFDFGNGTPSSFPTQGYLALTGAPEGGNPLQVFSNGQFTITTTTNAASENIYAGAIPSAGNVLHLAITINADTDTGIFYVNGSPQFSGPITLTPADIVTVDGNQDNWLGRSRFTSDTFMDGSIDEFRIYDEVLSPAQIATNNALGPNVIPEPRTYAMLLGAAVLSLAAWRRRQLA